MGVVIFEGALLPAGKGCHARGVAPTESQLSGAGLRS